MILPNPAMDFTPFDTLTAAELDDLVENDQAIASGLNDGTALTGIKKDLLTTDSNPYKFSAYRNAALTYGNPSSIACDTELFDTNNNFDSTSTKGRYTAPVSGFYWFTAAATVNASGSGYNMFLYKNGANELSGNGYIQASSWLNTFIVSGLIQLVAADYVEAFFYGSSQACITGKTNTYFHGFLMCRT